MPVIRFKGNKLPPDQIKALVAGTLVNGTRPSDWWKKQSGDFRNTFMGSIRQSMQNGESMTQAITRVTGGTIDGVSVPGIMKTTKKKAGALVSTAMSAVTNEAALKSYQANNDVIKAVAQLSTLDNRTSDICIAYSGQVWDLNTLKPIPPSRLPFNGGPPRHFNCRSRLSPITKSFKELGLDKEEFPPTTRASMDGQVPEDISFGDWLKTKPTEFQNNLLGPRRAQLWRDDKITLTQLVDMRGNPMTLTQLEASLGLKPKASFNPATGRMTGLPKPKPIKKPDKAKLLEEVNKTPTKPQVLPKSALKELADGDTAAAAVAEADEAATQARTLFNNTIANKIKNADLEPEPLNNYLEMVSASVHITDEIIASARARIDAAIKAARKKADAIVKKAKIEQIDNLDDFKTASAQLIVENFDDALVRQQVGKALGDIRKANDEVWALAKADKFLDQGKVMHAKDLLGQAPTTPAKMKKLQEIGAAQKQIGEIATKLNNFEPEDWADWVKFRDGLVPDDAPEWVKDELAGMIFAAEKQAEAIPYVKMAQKALDDLELDKAKDLINGLPQGVHKKFELKGKLQELELQQEQILKQRIMKFQDNAKMDLMHKGFADDIIDSMENELKSAAELKKGVWDFSAEQQIRLKALELRDLRDDAIDRIKSLNKQSKGMEAMQDFNSSLPNSVKYNKNYNEVFQSQLKLAKKKADNARKEFWKVLEDDIGSDEFGDYFDLITDLSKDFTKKLGKAQTQKKIAEIKTAIQNIKSGGGNINVAGFVDDVTDYGKEIQGFLHYREIDKLDDAARLFKADGNDPMARSKLFDVLGGKSEEQKRLIKEYVHDKANPKTLVNGKNWNEAVANVLTQHANHATNSDIMKLIEMYEEGLSAGMKTNFRQTIFTRGKVTSLDDLGVVPEGAPTPAVERIRRELAEHDPGEVPLPTYTEAEKLKAAKEWVSYADTEDARFLELAKERGKTHMRNSRAIIEEGDRTFGPNSWGITPDEWDEWMKKMVPELTDYDVALMNEYTGGMAKRINAGLYNGGMEFKQTAGARALNDALDKMPKYKGDVYRGTSPNGNWNADYVDARYEVGKTITERHFGSSATQEPASFGGPIQFFIKAKGKNGAIMGHIGQYGTGEMEVLWKAGTRFRVLRKKRDGQVIKVWMEEV